MSGRASQPAPHATVGLSLPPWRMEHVAPERMKTVAAILRDPTPIHWDRDFTRALGLEGRLLNQSPLNLGYVVNMLIAWAGPTCIRRLRSTFPLPVFDGDGVTAGGVVTDVVRANGETLAVCDVWLDRDDGSRTVAGRAWVAVADAAIDSSPDTDTDTDADTDAAPDPDPAPTAAPNE